MTLTELASFVTSKLSQTDTASVTACKSYINRRYQMIWDSNLWTDTLNTTSKAVAANETETSIDGALDTATGATQLALLLAVKFTVTGQDDGVELRGQDWVSFFQLDPNFWNNLASRRQRPANFVLLPLSTTGYIRLRLMPVPDAAGTVFCLGKAKFIELADATSATLRGIDNVLLAFAEGDMLERAKQYGKAQSKYAEAGAQYKVMVDLEIGQQQKNFVIIPSDVGDNSINDLI